MNGGCSLLLGAIFFFCSNSLCSTSSCFSFPIGYMELKVLIMVIILVIKIISCEEWLINFSNINELWSRWLTTQFTYTVLLLMWSNKLISPFKAHLHWAKSRWASKTFNALFIQNCSKDQRKFSFSSLLSLSVNAPLNGSHDHQVSACASTVGTCKLYSSWSFTKKQNEANNLIISLLFGLNKKINRKRSKESLT